jgi:hypothetical protein
MGQAGRWLQLGAGAVVGAAGATTLPNLVMGASNTGAVGYAATIAATAALAWAGHAFVKKPDVTAGIIAGGVGALIRRIIQDYAPQGSFLTALGMGDIITDFNFAVPQTIGGAGQRTLNNPYPMALPAATNVQGVPAHVMGASSLSGMGGRLY